MTKYLQFIDDGDDAATYPAERLISMTCASDGVLLLHFENSLDKSDGGDLVTLTITADKEKKVMRSIADAINSNEYLVTVADDIKAAATANIEIIDIADNDTTDINQLHGTNGFTLISTDTTSKEYIFDKNNALGATGTAHADGVVIQVNGMSAASDVANQVETAIEHANGHAGKILVNRLSNVLYLTQNVAGSAGNTLIDVGSMPVDNYINFSGRTPFTGQEPGFFVNGTDGTYIDSDITACALTSSNAGTFKQVHHFGLSSLDNATPTYFSWCGSNSNQTNIFNHRGIQPKGGKILEATLTTDGAISGATGCAITFTGSSTTADTTHTDTAKVWAGAAAGPITSLIDYTWAANDVIIGTVVPTTGSARRALAGLIIQWDN